MFEIELEIKSLNIIFRLNLLNQQGIDMEQYYMGAKHDFKDGDTAYLLLNPEIVPNGYVELLIYWSEKEDTLMAREVGAGAGRQTYHVDRWGRHFLKKKPGYIRIVDINGDVIIEPEHYHDTLDRASQMIDWMESKDVDKLDMNVIVDRLCSEIKFLLLFIE
jgi:hypothetical protein